MPESGPGPTDDPSFPDRGRVIGLDLGRRRIGVAVCDDGRTVATPLTTVKRVGDRPVEHAEIAGLLTETGATMLVVGLPLSLDGSEGPAARAVLAEVRALRKGLGVPVETQDERLTTVTGAESLAAGGVAERDRRPVIDQVAASILLQAWIDGLLR